MDKKKSKAIWLASLGLSSALALSGGYLLIPHEGEVKSGNFHVVYSDPVGIATVCWGLTGKDLNGKPLVVGQKYTEEDCNKMFVQRIQGFEKQVDSLVKVEYASPYQKAALISFSYNVGVGALSSSTLLRKLNAGDHIAACEELSRWVYANRKRLNGLVTRRAEEKQWCLGDVPYDVKDVYEEIINMANVSAKSKSGQGNEQGGEKETQQEVNPLEPSSQPANNNQCGWFKRTWGGC